MNEHERGMNVEGHIMGHAATFMRMREGIMIIKIRGALLYIITKCRLHYHALINVGHSIHVACP